MLSEPRQPLGNGRYDLREVLGAGGMATVYRAYDQRLQCERAIKVLAPALSERTSIRNRFIAEARTMARLQHPNIVHVDEVVYDEGPVYMVMEMVRRGSLMDILKHHGPMPPKLASAVLQPVLAALAVAHQAGIIHRDIKPHNILMTETGIPKLTDFGIAQIRGTSTSNTRTNTMMGTLAYMAPEQRSSARRVDARSDVYSVGATLFTLVTLKEPHDIFAQEIHTELLATVNEELARFIRSATRYKPEERYQSARDMLASLRALHPRLPDERGTWAGLDEASVGGSVSGSSEPSLPPTSSSLYPSIGPQGPPPGATIDAGLTMNLTGIGGMTIPSSAATKYVTGEGGHTMAPGLLGLDAGQHTPFEPLDANKTPFTIMPRDASLVDEPTTGQTAAPPPATAPGTARVNARTAIVSSLVSAVIATLVVLIGLWLRPDRPAAVPTAASSRAGDDCAGRRRAGAGRAPIDRRRADRGSGGIGRRAPAARRAQARPRTRARVRRSPRPVRDARNQLDSLEPRRHRRRGSRYQRQALRRRGGPPFGRADDRIRRPAAGRSRRRGRKHAHLLLGFRQGHGVPSLKRARTGFAPAV